MLVQLVPKLRPPRLSCETLPCVLCAAGLGVPDAPLASSDGRGGVSVPVGPFLPGGRHVQRPLPRQPHAGCCHHPRAMPCGSP